MVNAMKEAYLNNVIDEYDMRLRCAKGGNQQPSHLAEHSKWRLIRHFAAVVADLIDRGWIEIREPFTRSMGGRRADEPGRAGASVARPGELDRQTIEGHPPDGHAHANRRTGSPGPLGFAVEHHRGPHLEQSPSLGPPIAGRVGCWNLLSYR